MEMLVDLGLVDRKPDRGNFSWCVTDRTVRLAAALKPLTKRLITLAEFLDLRFMRTMAEVYDLKNVQPVVGEARLRAFAETFPKVGRELGFTPARTVATLASLAMIGEGRVLEVGEQLSAVRDAAKSPLAEFLHFSGGSRFDQEFLVRVDRKILPALASPG
jgi:hypothetical protein